VKNFCLLLAVVGSFWTATDYAWATQRKGSPAADVDVVARVNGEPVTQAEVQHLLATPTERDRLLQELGIQDPDGKALERLALRTVINRRLILQEADRRKLTVTEQDLDKAITSLRRRFADLRSLGRWMKEEGLDDKSLLGTIRDEMLAARVRAALVEGVQVSEEQVQQYYEAHKEDLRTEEVRLQMIVAKDETAAKEILAALERGDDFRALAQERSIGLRAARGGDTGWVDAETLWPPLRQTVATMKAGQAGGPLRRGDDFLIIRLSGRRSGGTKLLAEARPEIERRLLPTLHRQAVEAWLTEQERNSKIEVFLAGPF
jgi:parvulin-like peptidyl-prolyl isomerase